MLLELLVYLMEKIPVNVRHGNMRNKSFQVVKILRQNKIFAIHFKFRTIKFINFCII